MKTIAIAIYISSLGRHFHFSIILVNLFFSFHVLSHMYLCWADLMDCVINIPLCCRVQGTPDPLLTSTQHSGR